MDEQRLAEIEAQYEAVKPFAANLGMSAIVADLGDVLAEVRRLKRALALSEASRGVPATVGRD